MGHLLKGMKYTWTSSDVDYLQSIVAMNKRNIGTVGTVLPPLCKRVHAAVCLFWLVGGSPEGCVRNCQQWFP